MESSIFCNGERKSPYILKNVNTYGRIVPSLILFDDELKYLTKILEWNIKL